MFVTHFRELRDREEKGRRGDGERGRHGEAGNSLSLAQEVQSLNHSTLYSVAIDYRGHTSAPGVRRMDRSYWTRNRARCTIIG
ncbi:hypothetical protein KAW44_06470 [Candidatus Bipolaricaulota bacterium]|nr:hypothetical protein [Candidatus Bipolaricaulota bacterium]